MASTPSTRRLLGDRYDLLEQIGRGGMGVVWRARDLLLERDVAVKEIQFPPGTSEEERSVLRQRVFREARAAARLAHPSVVTVYDVIEEGGQPFIVMELIDAPSLTDIVRAGGPLPPERVAAIGLDVLSALEVAHAAGVVHRDIKPGNVMVPERGHCELADFGIASVQDDPSVTSTGLVLGSPAYMAPEQGSRGVTSPASDLWSLGATLFFAAEGMPPFEGDGALPTLSAVMNDAPRQPRRSGALAPIILALLDKDPARRPGHAAVRAELEAIAAQLPAAAATAVLPEPYPHEARAEDTLQLVRTDRAAGAPVSTAAAVAPPPRPVRRIAFDDLGEPPPPVQYDPVDRRRRGGAGMFVGLVVVAALIAAAIYGFTRLGSARPSARKTSSSSSAPAAAAPAAKPTPKPKASASPAKPAPTSAAVVSSAPAASVATSAPATSAPAASAPAAQVPAASTPAAATSAAAPGGVPADWVPFTHPLIGYTVLHPPGWTVTEKGLNTDIKDPSTGAYLRVAHTTVPGPDPTQDWIGFEPVFAARHPGYHRIALYPTTYHGMKAGYWEYTYGTQSLVRAVDLGFVTPDGKYGFALNFQTPRSLWAASQPTFDAFKASFRPPSG